MRKFVNVCVYELLFLHSVINEFGMEIVYVLNEYAAYFLSWNNKGPCRTAGENRAASFSQLYCIKLKRHKSRAYQC